MIKTKKLIAMLLCVVMIFSMIESMASANSETSTPSQKVEYTGMYAFLDEVNNTISVPTEIINAPESAILIIGGYSADVLSTVICREVGDTAEIPATNIDKIKVFLWDSLESMHSLLTPTELQIVKKGSIVAAIASTVPDPNNIPENIFDGDRSTVWGGNGSNAYLIADLGGEFYIEAIKLILREYEDNRTAVVPVSFSTDNETWEGLTSIDFSRTLGYSRSISVRRSARYVRLDIHGSYSDGEWIDWLTISELEVYVK